MDLTFVKEIFFELLVGVYPHNLDKLDDVLRLIKPVVISHAAIELLFAIFESEGEFGNYKKLLISMIFSTFHILSQIIMKII